MTRSQVRQNAQELRTLKLSRNTVHYTSIMTVSVFLVNRSWFGYVVVTAIFSTINFNSQLSRLQQIENSLARTVVKAPKSCHITPSFAASLHWLRITECIEYKLLSLTYKVLTTTQPPYLHKLISTQRPRSTRSSSVVTLARPPSSRFILIFYFYFFLFFCFWAVR